MQYLEMQPTQTQRILSSLTSDLTDGGEQEIARFAVIMQSPHKVIMGASDGGLKNQYGAFGWVWKDKDSEVSISGAGPSDARPQAHTSTRTEIAGMVAALKMLQLVVAFYEIEVPVSTRVKLCCDSRSAIKCAIAARDSHRWYSSSRCWANYDLYCELREIQIQLKFKVDFEWVKGHQSRNLGGATWALTPEARLNEEADRLASEKIRDREQNHCKV
jgi:ribonuclease HI